MIRSTRFAVLVLLALLVLVAAAQASSKRQTVAELRVQLHAPATVVSFFTSGKGRWMIERRHLTCDSVAGRPHLLCERSRRILSEATKRYRLLSREIKALEVTLSPCYHATGVGQGNPNVDLGCQMAAQRGWTGSQWTDLYYLWDGESGWSVTSHNPHSSACGIPQGLNDCSEGMDPAAQIEWGLNYIAARVDERTPEGARAHSRAFGWY